ncbi:MAG: transposase [bacterium]|nr:transposase [bacterium]
MRVEPYGIGSILHVTKRGTRGMDIVRDAADRNRFAKLLFYLNDTFYDSNWKKATAAHNSFERPVEWPEREPLARILAWTLVPNHFHLLLEEIREGGISKLMQRVCGSMSAHSNAKYHERGSIFQGSYRSRTVSEDSHFRYLAFYIQVKNVLELYPGGLKQALDHFDDAWEWATHYKYSSLPTFLAGTDSPITESESLRVLYSDTKSFKKEASGLLTGHIEHHTNDDSFAALALEPW